MNPFHTPLRSLIALAAALALTACGGGDADPLPSAAPANTDKDDADAATLAEVATLVQKVDATTQSAQSSGRFPGVAQTNLVANKPEYNAQILEPALKNAWGIAIRPAGLGGHFWIGAAGTAQSIQYVGDVGGKPLFQDELALVDTRGPVSGVVFNPGSQFTITQPHANGSITAPAKFVFANLSGTLTGWTERQRADGSFDRPHDSVVVVDGSARHSTFVGVTISAAGDRMYAADFGAQPAIRVFDGAFAETASLANPFQPAGAPRPDGFEAFNVQTVGDHLFAMYGRHVAADPNAPPPAEGRLAEFDASGKLVAHWPGRGMLNYPWGVALAPKEFGLYGGCLLVGNFGDGTMVAFHPRLKVALDYVRDAQGKKLVIDGLWGLQFGNGASLGEANHLYFAAGPKRETDGLFGKLQPNPQTLPLFDGLSLCR